MALKIQWTKRAEKSFERIVDYLLKNWSEKSAKKFVRTTNKKLEQIAENPKQYEEVINKKGVHRAVITRQTSVYYRVYNRMVRLITFWDNRRNPDSLKI